MQPSHRMIRTIGTSIVALFLVAGAAFATSAFVSGPRQADTIPVSLDEQATDGVGAAAETAEPTETAESETAEPAETAEPTETEDPAETPEATGDHHGDRHQAAGEVNTGQGDDSQGEDANEDHGGDHQQAGQDDGDHAQSGSDDHGGSGEDATDSPDHGGSGSDN